MSRTGFIQNEMDLKLLVLYIMDRAVAPITFLQLLDLALCDAGVDYFSLTEAVNHLTETEHLSLNGELYSITERAGATSRSARAVYPTPCVCGAMKIWSSSMMPSCARPRCRPVCSPMRTGPVPSGSIWPTRPVLSWSSSSSPPLWPRGRRSPVSSSSPPRPSTTRSWLCWYAIPRKNLIHLRNKKRKNSRKQLACGCFCFKS